MTRYRGSTPIVARYRGSTPILNRYRGSTLIWSADQGVRDDFIRLDANGFAVDTLNTLGPKWTDYGPSVEYKLGVEDGRARVSVPDAQLGGFWSLRTSTARYNDAVNLSDDGFVECRFATQGDGASLTSFTGYSTQVTGRGALTGVTNGCTIHGMAGHLWIATIGGSVLSNRKDCGTFQAGDVARLIFTGNVHTMLKNGTDVGQWIRTGSEYSVGPNFRSLALLGQGAKDLGGARRFSPALDYVMMG